MWVAIADCKRITGKDHGREAKVNGGVKLDFRADAMAVVDDCALLLEAIIFSGQREDAALFHYASVTTEAIFF